MTLRIFEEGDEREAVLALHGWLSAAEVDEVVRVAAAAAGRPLRVDLAHLVSVDVDGLQVLQRLRRSGAQLTGASPYVELLLERTDLVGDDGPVK